MARLDEQQEEWRDIKGYEGIYQVSNIGRVKSLKRIIRRKDGRIKTIREIILKNNIHKSGYLEVNLNLNGTFKTVKVHRLVAEAFIPNYNNYKEINHKDEDKSNNNVNNLEWCTSSYNANYGTRNVRSALLRMKGIVQYTSDGVFVKEHTSLTSAGEYVNGNAQGVFLCANNKIKRYKGYIWKYKKK